jgi:outer membrane protein OmpA-like peptidoglycan-associated protein
MIKYLLFISTLERNTIFAKKSYFYFDLDQDYLNSKSEMKFTQWLQDKQQIKISRIEAYCDSTASFSYNMLLANRRAKYIKKRF